MNLILSIIFFWLPLTAFAQFKCDKKINQNKIVLFIDANNSPTEINGAAKAACVRGENFKVIPEKGRRLTPTLVDKTLKELASKNQSVASMVVSGHDGGGTIHGVYGGIDKYQIITSLKNAYQSRPDLLKELKSIYMWGCWTMGPSEVEVWKDELPNIKLAAGFMDMGPLNTTRAAYSVLNDLLIKEPTLIEQSDKQKLKRAISGITDINQTLAAVYTDAVCGDMYYYRTQGDHQEENQSENPLFSAGTHYVNFSENFDCKGMAKSIEQKRVELLKYYHGTVPLPEDKPGSPIRNIYSFMRHASKCIKDNHVLNPDRIFLLRFYDAVKENFALSFENEITDANKEYAALNDLIKTAAKDTKRSALIKYINENRSKYFNPRKETLKNKGRKEIKEMISYLDGLTKQEIFKVPKNKDKVNKINKMKKAMETYLYQLNPKCMDFMEWHEVTPNHRPAKFC